MNNMQHKCIVHCCWFPRAEQRFSSSSSSEKQRDFRISKKWAMVFELFVSWILNIERIRTSYQVRVGFNICSLSNKYLYANTGILCAAIISSLCLFLLFSYLKGLKALLWAWLLLTRYHQWFGGKFDQFLLIIF